MSPRRPAAAALGALVLAGALALTACAERVRIVYTNDLHLRLARLASIERVIAEARAAGDPVLLLDAGDAWQDFRVALYAVWGAERMLDWMNRVGYDAMAPGNHDLYWSWPKVGELVSRAAFPVLCADLVAVDGESSPFATSARIQVGRLDVLIVGLAPLEDLPVLDLPWLRPVEPVLALRRAIAAATGTPDLIVCLAHVPVAVAEDLARSVPEIDVFVTGHSHEMTLVPRLAGDSFIVQSGAFGEYVGELTLEVGELGVQAIGNTLVPTSEEAATDTGRGLIQLLAIALAIVAFLIVLVL